MNLGALNARAADTESASRMYVVDPETKLVLVDANKKECFIDFLSVDSETGRGLDRQRSMAQMAKLRSGRNRRGGDEDDDLIKLQIESLSALATGWYFGAAADPFSRDAAEKLFSDPQYAWLRRDAWVFINDTANFIKGSSKASAGTASTSSDKTGA